MSIKIEGQVKYLCDACNFEFETHAANVGPWLMFCDECEGSFERDEDDAFESALWDATRKADA